MKKKMLQMSNIIAARKYTTDMSNIIFAEHAEF